MTITDNTVGSGAGESESLSMLRGMRIVIVLESLIMGGAERQALLLARYLAQRHRAHVQILGILNSGRLVTVCEKYGIPWRMEPLPWPRSRIEWVKSLAKFALTLRRIRPDALLPYTMFPNVVCGLVWPWTGARLCVWNQRDEGRARMRRKAERWATRLTPWFVSNSNHGADFLVNILGVDRGRVRVIRNGIELETPESDRAAWRRHLGVSDDCFLACMIAHLHEFKDHATLLHAWRTVIEHLDAVGRSAVLLLAGRFDSTHHILKSLAFDLGLGGKVKFLGDVEDIAGLLQSVDLGVFSSRLEGCPNGVLECMAAGLAIAGTDIPGLREAVGPKGSTLLVPAGDAEALAARILELAADPELRATLGRENRSSVETKFNPRQMCDEMVSLITDAFRNPSRFRRDGLRPQLELGLLSPKE